MRKVMLSLSIAAALLAQPGRSRAGDFIVRSIERDQSTVRVLLEVDTNPLKERIRRDTPSVLVKAAQDLRGISVKGTPVLRSVSLILGTDAKSFSIRTRWDVQTLILVSSRLGSAEVSMNGIVDLDGRAVCDMTPTSKVRARVFVERMVTAGKALDVKALNLLAGTWEVPLNQKGVLEDVKVLDFRIQEITESRITVEATLDGSEPAPATGAAPVQGG